MQKMPLVLLFAKKCVKIKTLIIIVHFELKSQIIFNFEKFHFECKKCYLYHT